MNVNHLSNTNPFFCQNDTYINDVLKNIFSCLEGLRSRSSYRLGHIHKNLSIISVLTKVILTISGYNDSWPHMGGTFKNLGISKTANFIPSFAKMSATYSTPALEHSTLSICTR